MSKRTAEQRQSEGLERKKFKKTFLALYQLWLLRAFQKMHSAVRKWLGNWCVFYFLQHKMSQTNKLVFALVSYRNIRVSSFGLACTEFA